MRRRGTHARLLRQRAVALLLVVRGDRMPSRSGESDRRRRRNRSAEGDPVRAGGSGEDRGGVGIGTGGESGGRGGGDGGGAESAGGGERALEVAVEGCTVRGSVSGGRFHWVVL